MLGIISRMHTVILVYINIYLVPGIGFHTLGSVLLAQLIANIQLFVTAGLISSK